MFWQFGIHSQRSMNSLSLMGVSLFAAFLFLIPMAGCSSNTTPRPLATPSPTAPAPLTIPTSPSMPSSPTGTSPTASATEPPTTIPWPNVKVYTDPNTSIITQVNGTFAIVVPNSPIPFGWGWENRDEGAFSLLDQAFFSIPGTPGEFPPPRALADLFKALKVGKFQILLVEHDKSEQQLASDSFSVVVNP